MINIKYAVTTAAASVVVTTATVAHLVRKHKDQTKTTAVEAETIVKIVETTMTADMAWKMAQDETSRRIMDGYYDEKSDADIRRDFEILHNTYLSKI